MAGTELAAIGRRGRSRPGRCRSAWWRSRWRERRYARRRPEESVLFGVVQQELETFLARAPERERRVRAQEMRA